MHNNNNNNKRYEGGITTKEKTTSLHTYIHTYTQEREKKIQSFIPSLHEYQHDDELRLHIVFETLHNL
jgi:hypothetical protein